MGEEPGRTPIVLREVLEGRLLRLGERCHCIESTPNGSSNAGIVVGDDATLVVDSRLTPALAAQLHGIARRLSARPGNPVYLVNTHYHGDHCFGNAAFDDSVTIATAWTRTAMAERWAAQVDEFVELRPHQADAFRAARPRVPALGLTDTVEVDLGGVSARLRATGHGHTPGDLVVEVPDEGVLYSADLVFHGHWPVLWDADVAGWLEALDDLAATAPEVVVPGHGPVAGGSVLQEMRDGLCFLLTHAAAGGDRSPDELVEGTAFEPWLHRRRVGAALASIREALESDPRPAAAARAATDGAPRAGAPAERRHR